MTILTFDVTGVWNEPVNGGAEKSPGSPDGRAHARLKQSWEVSLAAGVVLFFWPGAPLLLPDHSVSTYIACSVQSPSSYTPCLDLSTEVGVFPAGVPRS